MKNGLFFAGVIAAGISAAYLLDEKRGPKRRRAVKKKTDLVLTTAGRSWDRYSHELKPYWQKYSKEFAEGAEDFAKQGMQRFEKATQNGWAPSARLLGATASTMAFYGAGKKGILGAVLRMVSLGLFTRALLASK